MPETCPTCAAQTVLVRELEKRLVLLDECRKEALQLAERGIRERLADTSAHLEAMKDQAATFITRKEVYWMLTTFGSLILGLLALVEHFGGK